MSHIFCTNCIAQLARATWKLQPSVFVDGAHKTHKEQQEAEMKSSQFYACVEQEKFWSRLMLLHSPSSVPYKLQLQPYPVIRYLALSLLFSAHKKSFTCGILQFNVNIFFLNKIIPKGLALILIIACNALVTILCSLFLESGPLVDFLHVVS